MPSLYYYLFKANLDCISEGRGVVVVDYDRFKVRGISISDRIGCNILQILSIGLEL